MMLKLNTPITLDQLDSWGTVVDLGSTIVEGDANAYGKFTLGTPDQPSSGGYFGVTKSIFRMTYPFSEQATVVKGQVTLTNEDTGEKWTFKEGDSWIVEKGTKVLWQVDTDYFIKHYFSAN
ncbi:hypothetical protein DKL61_07930 [Gammaproteobacteria bacterium ESL0073]|nr:hypothetical protein DKL61_07930 [Gammaproteobacteria bacterium ESL0073]